MQQSKDCMQTKKRLEQLKINNNKKFTLIKNCLIKIDIFPVVLVHIFRKK